MKLDRFVRTLKAGAWIGFLSRNATNESGFFRLAPVPPGKQLFVIDALNSPPIDEVTYATLEFELSVIQGQDNTIQMPAILPPLDPLSVVEVSEVQGGTLTLRADPLWKLFLKPGQAVFPDASRRGRIFVTAVPADKIPMAPPEGKLSRLFVAVEPPLVRFDPPADVQFPNVDNMAPGTVTEIFSFDHAAGRFVPVGRGQVSEDGGVVRSLPGEGLIHGGWHDAPVPTPTPTTWLDAQVPFACSVSVGGQAAIGAPRRVLLCNIPSFPFKTVAFCPRDTDGDGIPDEDEPPGCEFSPDCDGDGFSDGFERDNGTDPQNPGDRPTVELTLTPADIGVAKGKSRTIGVTTTVNGEARSLVVVMASENEGIAIVPSPVRSGVQVPITGREAGTTRISARVQGTSARAEAIVRVAALGVTVSPRSVEPLIPTSVPSDRNRAGVNIVGPADSAFTIRVIPTVNSGGHNHDSEARPRGTFNGTGESVLSGFTDGNGAAFVTYTSNEVGGRETIRVVFGDGSEVQDSVIVRAPGLAPLGRGANYRLSGGTDRHLGPVLSPIDNNHFGGLILRAQIARIADVYVASFTATVGVNDMSLPNGGLFDIAGTWAPPHNLHRTGNSVDFDNFHRDIRTGKTVSVEDMTARLVKIVQDEELDCRRIVEETIHFECPR